ncbi:MAG UNVERIFIED_CONTAM: hypothetical protein LVR18_42455 [Planctomycetaceae bacterium]
MSCQRLGLWLGCLICVCWCSSGGIADDVQVGLGVGRMLSEGGDWKPETSPLTAPFGVAFDRARRAIWIVELEGGRVHRLSADGRLQQAVTDRRSYKGDGGPLFQATLTACITVLCCRMMIC